MELIDGTVMLGFEGTEAPGWVMDRLEERNVPGFTLFALNIESTSQLVELNQRLHSGSATPRLIATDQEGGQLNAFGDGTPFAGNMALGAVGDDQLALEVGRATGRELRAVGVTVNYAPVCDVASRPQNPSLGIRSIGEVPEAVGRMAAALVQGMQAEGVAAVIKHFPGKGEARVDPHYELPVLDMDRDHFDSVEFPPFQAGIGAGAKMVMMGHYACPQLTGSRHLPSSLSSAMVDGILRTDLGFDGVVITDALDMGAVQGEEGVDAFSAVAAGVDLLLCARDPEDQDRFRDGLLRAHQSGRLGQEVLRRSGSRVDRLRSWLATFAPPDLSVIKSSEHLLLAKQLAERAITLVRNDAGLIPLRLQPTDQLLVILPNPTDLTPADTSSRERPADNLGAALRRHHPSVQVMTVDYEPIELSGVVSAVREHQLVIVGTITANREQAEMVSAILATGTPTVVVALRVPEDLALYPRAPTYLCTYGILPPSMDALGEALFGAIPLSGRLPMAIPELYPAGHGLTE